MAKKVNPKYFNIRETGGGIDTERLKAMCKRLTLDYDYNYSLFGRNTGMAVKLHDDGNEGGSCVVLAAIKDDDACLLEYDNENKEILRDTALNLAMTFASMTYLYINPEQAVVIVLASKRSMNIRNIETFLSRAYNEAIHKSIDGEPFTPLKIAPIQYRTVCEDLDRFGWIVSVKIGFDLILDEDIADVGLFPHKDVFTIDGKGKYSYEWKNSPSRLNKPFVADVINFFRDKHYCNNLVVRAVDEEHGKVVVNNIKNPKFSYPIEDNAMLLDNDYYLTERDAFIALHMADFLEHYRHNTNVLNPLS